MGGKTRSANPSPVRIAKTYLRIFELSDSCLTARSESFINVGDVQITILMPLRTYDGLVDNCDQSSREYAILKNGLIIRRPKGDHFERIMEIRCEMEEADKLLALASKVYPEAVEYIVTAINAALKSD